MAFEQKNIDVVLVYPPAEYVLEVYDLPDFPNIGIAYIGGYLEQHKNITPGLIDARFSRLSVEETAAKIIELKPKIVGIGAMTPMVKTASRVIDLVKRALPEVKTVLGGFHATFMPERSLNEFPMFDYMVVGEGEMAFAELVEKTIEGLDCTKIGGVWTRENGRVSDQGRGRIPATLDELGSPGWHLYEPDAMATYARSLPVMGQRGCPFSCNFCSRPYGQKVRKRTPGLIVDEIERDIENFGVKKIHFYDETFSVDKKHTMALCGELIERGLSEKTDWTSMVHANTIDLELVRKMKEAGCVFAGFGVETGDDDIMAQMNKGVTKEKIIKAREVLRQVGITTSAYFVIGHPNETRKSIFRTIMFAAKLNPDIAAIGIMVPYPGSQIWELASRGEGGYKKISTDWTHFNKQLGNAVLMENYGRREAELFQLLGYALIYILNFRFIDLAKIAAANFKLLASIFLKIILPPNHRPAFIMFRNDGGRALKKRHMKSWG